MYGKMATKREKERGRIEERKGFVARFTTFGKRIGDCRVNSGRKSRERWKFEEFTGWIGGKSSVTSTSVPAVDFNF